MSDIRYLPDCVTLVEGDYPYRRHVTYFPGLVDVYAYPQLAEFCVCGECHGTGLYQFTDGTGASCAISPCPTCRRDHAPSPRSTQEGT